MKVPIDHQKKKRKTEKNATYTTIGERASGKNGRACASDCYEWTGPVLYNTKKKLQMSQPPAAGRIVAPQMWPTCMWFTSENYQQKKLMIKTKSHR